MNQYILKYDKMKDVKKMKQLTKRGGMKRLRNDEKMMHN